jgi:hypothetical protein
MFTEPKIINSDNLKARSYILLYFNGKRVRLYNGNTINKQIHPNRATNFKDRIKLLNELLFEIKNALRNNTFQPEIEPHQEDRHSQLLILLMITPDHTR